MIYLLKTESIGQGDVEFLLSRRVNCDSCKN